MISLVLLSVVPVQARYGFSMFFISYFSASSIQQFMVALSESKITPSISKTTASKSFIISPILDPYISCQPFCHSVFFVTLYYSTGHSLKLIGGI